VVATQTVRKSHRLARPLAAGLVGPRQMGGGVGRPERKWYAQLRVARQAVPVPGGVGEHRARDRLVAGEASGEEIGAVGVTVVRGLAEVEDDDPADAALRGVAPLQE